MSEPSVLLVEDSLVHAAVATCALAASGGRVEHCSTLAAALARLGDARRAAPTAVLLDLTLPDSEGVETFDRLAAIGPPPVVVLSADDDPAQALALIERGAQDYLVKGENSGPAIARSVRLAVERGRLREEQTKVREQAEASVRSQRAFVAAMSHEVRTPLNAILGMSELLAQTPLDLTQREYVEIARRCGLALKGLLDNALELSRLESGGVELAREAFELEWVVQECVEAFALAAHQKGIALFADLADDAIGTVIGDEGHLRQVLFNLIGNAVKFTERGQVIVRARARDRGLTLEVADTGIGIPPDRQHAVFERFVQAESGINRRYGGSGLGLALCRELVAAMDGEIRVESQGGAGSVFRVELPLQVQARGCHPTLAEQRILAVLGDPVERRSVASRLRRRGAQVLDVATIEEAQRLLGSDLRFDAALLDIRLPEGGGLQLLGRLEPEARAGVHWVVLLPMNHRVGDLARCEAIGAVALCKPAGWERLERALREGSSVSAAAPPGTAPSFADRRILLAEDSPENRVIALAHLRATGCMIEIALDGQEAVEKWREGGFDLVLMDLHMPEMNGVDAARRIRAEERDTGRRRTPIVAITADRLSEQRDACAAAGFDAHLGKPFMQADLYRTLRLFLPAEARPAARENGEAICIPQELADLAEEYLANRRADGAALQRAAYACDFEAARRLGHRMKGSGAGYGFPRVTELGARIEEAARRGDAASIAKAAAELSEYADKTLAAVGQQAPEGRARRDEAGLVR